MSIFKSIDSRNCIHPNSYICLKIISCFGMGQTNFIMFSETIDFLAKFFILLVFVFVFQNIYLKSESSASFLTLSAFSQLASIKGASLSAKYSHPLLVIPRLLKFFFHFKPRPIIFFV